MTGRTKTNGELIKEYLEEQHHKDIENIINEKTTDLIIDYETFDKEIGKRLSTLLIKKPMDIIEQFGTQTKKIIGKKNKTNIKFKNVPRTNINNLLSEEIGNLIATEGIIKGLYEITPHIHKAVYECKQCKRQIKMPPRNNINIKPSLCPDCGERTFNLVEDKCEYIDTRLATIEEFAEEKTTVTSRQIDVVLEEDLIYKADIGDKIKLTGIFKTKNINDDYRFYIYGNHIEKLTDEEIILTDSDIKEIKAISKKEDIIDVLCNSLAPDLIINKNIKLASLCYIVKGIKAPRFNNKVKNNDRTFINILFITDPAMAKSDLAKRIDGLTEKGFILNGASTTSAGLIGAVVKDQRTGQFKIEVGAIPLANNGHLIVDEFDKISEEESKKLLSFMENGEDTIAKAGLKETFKGETSILGLSNPIYGSYDRYKSLTEQVKVYNALLSRFDLLFLMGDIPNEETDTEIAKSILGLRKDVEEETIEYETLKKYLKYASSLKPMITTEAKEKMVDFYVKIRNSGYDNFGNPIKIDARALQSIARISGALARLKLKEIVTPKEVEEAIDIKMFSIKQIGEDPETGIIDPTETVGGNTNRNKEARGYLLKTLKEYTEKGVTVNKTKLTDEIMTEYDIPRERIRNAFNEMIDKEITIEKGNKKEQIVKLK